MKKIKMWEYLLQHNKKSDIVIKVVYSMEIVNWDGDYGYAGENYLVTVGVSIPDLSSPSGAKIDVDRKCLVNTNHFNKWYFGQEIIKWVD